VTIYADTSFLVSYLYPGDHHHQASRQFFRQQASADWITSSWSQFETINTLRQLCLQKPGPDRTVIEALRLLFKHWHRKGPFLLERLSADEALIECAAISAGHGATMKMRGADTLHVALLEQFSPDLFVTRDRDQFHLAQARGFSCRLLP